MTFEDILTLLHDAGKLKTLKREGWLRNGIPRPESVAEHSFRTALLAMLLAERTGLDPGRACEMALIHDLPEAETGDIVPGEMHPLEKTLVEDRAAERMFGKLHDGERLLRLWGEYRAGETPVSLVVRDADKLEMAMQALEYGRSEGTDLSEFLDSAESALALGESREMLREMKGRRG